MGPSTSTQHTSKTSKDTKPTSKDDNALSGEIDVGSTSLSPTLNSSTQMLEENRSSSLRRSDSLSSGCWREQRTTANPGVSQTNIGSSSTADARCPHCQKLFSKRFSIPKHVQVGKVMIIDAISFWNSAGKCDYLCKLY